MKDHAAQLPTRRKTCDTAVTGLGPLDTKSLEGNTGPWAAPAGCLHTCLEYRTLDDRATPPSGVYANTDVSVSLSPVLESMSHLISSFKMQALCPSTENTLS